MNTSIYIGFSKPRGLKPVAEVIRLVEQTPFNHVYIRFQDPTTRLRMVLEASHTTVHLEECEAWRTRNEEVFEVRQDISAAQFEQVLSKGFIALQKPYSVLGLLGHLAMRVLRLPRNPYKDKGRSYICSELVAHVLDIPNPEEQTPRTLFEHLQPTLPPDHDEVI